MNKKKYLQKEAKELLKDNEKDLKIIESDLKSLERLQNEPNYEKYADEWRKKFLGLKELRLIQREKLIDFQKKVNEL